MKNFFSVITMNLVGYDMIIFIVAVCNAAIYYLTRRSADDLYKKMHMTIFVPDKEESKAETDTDLAKMRESDVVSMRNRTAKLYSVFVNLTGIFPLLGILGTVTALLSLVQDMSDVTGNFYGALTSTFWGLVFAITFKLLDGIISAKIEDNEKTVQLYLERNSIVKSDKAEKYE